MPLIELKLTIEKPALPADVRAFLREAERRIELFRHDGHIPGFVPSDFPTVYHALKTLATEGAAPGDLFCEWGSGFGVVACLASMVGFEACGIEIEGELVEAARQLAEDFGLSVDFLRGSFIPEDTAVRLDVDDGFSWLTTHGGIQLEESGFDPADFDTIFAYPWPDEEHVIEELFAEHAAVGSVLVSYHGGEELRLRRKTLGGRKRR